LATGSWPEIAGDTMVCDQYRCIFVHIPKAAGQSIEEFFIDQLGLDRERDRETLLLQDNRDAARGTEKLSHLSAAEYLRCGHVSPAVFSSYFKFSFVRNPWTRILSEYRYRNYFCHVSFRDFVLRKLPKPGWDDKYRHVMPQYDMLHDANGAPLVDFIGRFENLQADFKAVCRHLNIDEAELPHRNKSDKRSRNVKRRVRNWVYQNGENRLRSPQELYDADTRDAVAEYYRRDIEAFGYEYPYGG
jgi:hypothetical protein